MPEYNYDQQLARMVLGKDAPAESNDDLATAAAGTAINGPAPDPQLLVNKFKDIAEPPNWFDRASNAAAGGLATALGAPQPAPGQREPTQILSDAAKSATGGLANAIGAVPGATTTPGSPDYAGPMNPPSQQAAANGPAAALGAMAQGNVGAERGTSGQLGSNKPTGSGGGSSATNPSDAALLEAADQTESIIKQQVAEETGPELARGAKQLGAVKDRYMEITQQVQDHTMDALAKYQKIAEDYMSSKVDPNQWFTTRDFGGKVAAATAMGLGAFGAALNGGPNAPAAMIAKMVDDNIQEQKDAIERKKTGGGMMLSLAKEYQAAGATANQAIAQAGLTMKAYADQYVESTMQNLGGASLAQAQGWRQQVQDQLHLKSETAKAVQMQAEASINFVGAKTKKYDLERQQEIDKQFGVHPAGYIPVPGTGGQYAPEKIADKAMDAGAAYGQAKSALESYFDSLNTPDGLLAENRRASAAVAAGAVGKYIGLARAAGAPEETVNAMKEIANPSWFMNKVTPGNAAEKAAAALTSIESMNDATMSAMGLGKKQIRTKKK